MNPQRKIGLFVIGGLTLMALGLVLFSAGRWFRDTTMVMMTFEGDVKGLSVGSNVTFRGVQVGSVTSLSLHLEADGSLTVPVVAEIDANDRFFDKPSSSRKEIFDQLLANGLKARLVSESLVTGLLQIQLEFFPQQKGYVIPQANRYPYLQIPTVPTVLEQATYRVEKFLESMERLPVADILNSLNHILGALDRHLNSPEFAQLLSQTSEASAQFNELLAYVNTNKATIASNLKNSLRSLDQMTARMAAAGASVESLSEAMQQSTGSIDQSLLSLNQTLQQATHTLKVYEELARPDTQLQQQLMQTLRSFEASSLQIRQLAETLQRNPEALITGKQRR